MTEPPNSEFRSAERLAFELYLRTGKRIARGDATERKFNPYHDPRNGRFTFAPGGPRSVGAATSSDPRGVWQPKPKPPDTQSKPAPDGSRVEKVLRDALPTETAQTAFQLANRGGRGPRRGRGSSGGRPSGDPKLLDDLFPGLSRSPLGSVVRMVDGAFELTTAANEATRAIHNARVRRLVAEIRQLNPNYRFDSLGEPDTIDGRINQVKGLLLRRAVEFHRQRGDLEPLKVEVSRIMQERADAAYEEAVKRYEAGRLSVRLSREEAIGNYVDAAVRADLRRVLNVNGVDTSVGQPVRVVGREYATTGDERTYRIPDARVGDVAFDVTLTQKTLSTPQVRGFFRSDFQPQAVVIIRPTQLGGNHTYAIKRPRTVR